MNQEISKQLAKDPDGLLTYEYIANHIGNCDDYMADLVENMINVDTTGQFIVSAARYLNAIDPERYRPHIERLIAAAIDCDREHRYLGDLLQAIWGEDYETRADILSATDNNFRRIYKRLFPTGKL
ncbi:MAG: hypothetical protein J1E84_00700 [Muribaculaceae bacterium]|nr:hypothetical protein [Muribaculaceae bacterium]